MRCADLQALLCDYIEGTLTGPERALVERHLTSCPDCAAMARDASAALGYLRAVPDLEPPPELVNRILFQIPTHAAYPTYTHKTLPNWLTAWFRPLLQPRFAMGMAMTILSFSMLARFAGIGPRQLGAAELNPVRLWQSLDDTAHRAWERARKFYLSLRLVYEIQAQLHEWTQQLREQGVALEPAQPEQTQGSRPAEPAGAGSTRPAATPKSGTGESQQ